MIIIRRITNRRRSPTIRESNMNRVLVICFVILKSYIIASEDGIMASSGTTSMTSSTSSNESSSSRKCLTHRFPDDPRSRLLKDNNNNNDKTYVDLSSYSLRFDKCQYVKTFDDDIVAEGEGKVFAMQHLVVFRMCPIDSGASIDSCGSCETNYGEYAVQASDYLTQIAMHHQSRLEDMCSSCKKYCQKGDVDSFYFRGSAVSCGGCANKCTMSQNLAASGYVDAADYITCTPYPVYYQDTSAVDDASDGYETADDQLSVKYYYVGPKCSKESSYSKVTRIRIGVFTDENCWYPASGVNVEELLGYKISYRNFRTNMSGGNCLSCEQLSENEQGQGGGKNNNNNNNNKNNDQSDSVKLVCNNLYSVAAKCETKHGFLDGLARYSAGYENQIANEFDACTFVENVVFESYNAYGEIEIKEEQHVYERITTRYQKTALLGLMATFIGFIVYINILHAEIDEGYPTIRSMLIGQGIISEEDPWASSIAGIMT